MSANLEKIYREHIAPLGRADQLKLIEKVASELAVNDGESAKKHSLLELEGLGAEIWEGIDAQEYVNKLRDEWEHRR